MKLTIDLNVERLDSETVEIMKNAFEGKTVTVETDGARSVGEVTEVRE